MITAKFVGSDMLLHPETEEDKQALFIVGKRLGVIPTVLSKQRKRNGLSPRPCIRCGRKCQSKDSICHFCKVKERESTFTAKP